MSPRERTEREHRALVLARLALAQDRIANARRTLERDGFGERFEIDLVRALSELDAAERLNQEATEALGSTVP